MLDKLLVLFLFLFEFWMITFLITSHTFIDRLPVQDRGRHVLFSFFLFINVFLCMFVIITNKEKLKYIIN